MRVSIDMPHFSEDGDSRIESWLKNVGDPVARGDVIAIIESDKASMDLESFQAGTLVEIVHPAGDDVPAGEPIAWLEVDA